MKKSDTAKFIAVIDLMATSEFKYKALEAKNEIEAMNEARQLIGYHTYLVSIFKKEKTNDREKVKYSKFITNRGNGWRTNEDGEHEASIYFYYKWHDGISPITSSDVTWEI